MLSHATRTDDNPVAAETMKCKLHTMWYSKGMYAISKHDELGVMQIAAPSALLRLQAWQQICWQFEQQAFLSPWEGQRWLQGGCSA